VVNDKNVVEKRFVKAGRQQDDGLQVVLDGIKPGEWIVVNGLQRARPGKPVTPQRAEMPALPTSTEQVAAASTTQATAE
jgi:multidrug efflux pump subunit AcrA (membrane-fusion protein)